MAMTQTEMEAIGIPHKLFAVFTNPDGKLFYRKMWSMRLVAYLSGIGAIQGKAWDVFIKNAEIGQVWDVPQKDGTWMALVRIREDEDLDDTA